MKMKLSFFGKAKQLKNANITYVSFCARPVNGKSFLITKSGENVELEKDIQIISKSEDEKQLVYGVVYEPDSLDKQEHFAKAEDIERMAHSFMTNGGAIDLQHNLVKGFGTVVESYIAPCEMNLGEQSVIKGSWVLVVKATNEIWQLVKSGDIDGFSMFGTSQAVEVEIEPKKKSLAKSLLPFKKANKQETAIGKAFGEVIKESNFTTVENAKISLKKHYELQEKELNAMFPENNNKEDTKMEMSKEEVIELFKSLREIEKKEEEIKKAQEVMIKKAVSDTVSEEIAKALAPLMANMPQSRQVNGQEIIEKAENTVTFDSKGNIEDY